MKILFLAANPHGTSELQLDKEAKEIEDGLERSKLRDQFMLVTKWAVDSETLRRAMLKEQPDIVHFSGHGEGQAGLVLVGQDGKSKPATADALAGLFEIFRNVKCVLLNACYAEVQARAIVQYIDYVIGMERAVRDDAAIAFSTGFYDGLGYGLSIEDAFKLGRNAIQFELASFSSTTRKATPVNLEEFGGKLELIADHLVPILLKKKLLAPENPVGLTITHPIQTDNLSEKLKTESSNKVEASQRYRKRVKEFLGDHELTPIEMFQLATLAKVLVLSESEANRILEEEQNQVKLMSESFGESSLLSQSTVAVSNLTSLQKANFQKWGMLASGAILFSLLSAIVVNYSWQQFPRPLSKPRHVTSTPTSVDPGITEDLDITERKINQRGLELIMAFEPLVLETTIDPLGIPTIGYGSTKGVRRGMKITQAQAEELLKIDLAPIEKSVANMVKVPLTNDQFSALVSISYNLGSTTLADSTLLKVLNLGNHEKAADEFLIWDNGGREANPDPTKVSLDLSLRRQAERALFLGYNIQPFVDAKNVKK